MDNFNKTLEISSDEFQFLGSAAQEVEIRLASSEKQIEITAVKFNQLAAAIGGQFRDEVTGVISSTGELAAAAKRLVDDGAFDEFFDLVKPLLVDLEKTILTIAENLPAAFDGVSFDRLIDSLESIGVSLGGVFDIDLQTVEGLQSVLQFLVDGLAALNEVSAAAITNIAPLIQGIGAFAKTVIDAGPELTQLAGSIGGLAVTLNTVLPLLGGFAGVLGVVAGAKGLGAAASAVSGLATSAATLPGVLGASVGAVGALGTAAAAAGAAGVGLLSYEVTKAGLEATGATTGIVDFIASVTGLDDSVDDLLAPVSAASLGLEAMGDAAAATDAAIGNSTDNIEKGRDALIDWGAELGDLAEKTEQSSATISEAADELGDYEAAVQGLIPVTKDIADQWRDSADALDAATLVAGQARREYAGSVVVYNQVAKGARVVTDTLETLADKGEITKEKYAELVNELEAKKIDVQAKFDIRELEVNAELAKKQLETFETITTKKIDLDIERLKQDTERARILVGSIDNAISTVGGNISSILGLIGELDDADGLAAEKFEVFQNQLEIENTRFDAMIENQTKLVDAQVDNLRAQALRARRGDALIKITGDGLEPELEAFMFRILERIQVRANSDGQQFLLGFSS